MPTSAPTILDKVNSILFESWNSYEKWQKESLTDWVSNDIITRRWCLGTL